MSPQDDPLIPGLGPLGRPRKTLVTGIPSQAVEALRDEFRQALRHAGSESDQPEHHEPPPEESAEPEEPLPELEPQDAYDEHGELLKPPPKGELPHLDLEG